MPARTPARQRLVSQIAAITKNRGPDDPRLADLRQQLDATAVTELQQQVAEMAASLTPLNADEVRTAARAARRIGARRKPLPSDEESAA